MYFSFWFDLCIYYLVHFFCVPIFFFCPPLLSTNSCHRSSIFFLPHQAVLGLQLVCLVSSWWQVLCSGTPIYSIMSLLNFKYSVCKKRSIFVFQNLNNWSQWWLWGVFSVGWWFSHVLAISVRCNVNLRLQNLELACFLRKCRQFDITYSNDVEIVSISDFLSFIPI